MKVDPRFLTGQGQEVFTGSELLVKGALETAGGVHLLTGYPGSPVAGFFDAITQIKDLLNERGIRAVLANNEALSVAMLNGSQLAACRGIACMKSVGVHVAADALALGNLAGPNPEGGALVVYGDDPWSDSTQVPADSRYISKHLFIPTLEPSTPQEVKDFVELGFKLSVASDLYAGYVLTTNLADGGGSVQCRPNQYPRLNTHQRMVLASAAIDLNKRVLLPPRTWWQEESLPGRLGRAARAATGLGLNRIDYPAGARKPLGFATSGLAYGYLLQTLLELGLLGEYPILKFGLTYPLDGNLVRQLAGQCERIIVVEERRGFLQEQISQFVLDDRQRRQEVAVEVWGKDFPGGLRGLPSTRGLHPSILVDRLVPLLKQVHGNGQSVRTPSAQAWDREKETADQTGDIDLSALPARLATFCPGCPHRDSASICLEIKQRFMDAPYMLGKHGRGQTDLIFHGDTGCYTMLMFPPNEPLMHDYSGMGLGAGTGAGIDAFIDNKQVVFMGDSTFFHSGQIAISQAIKLGQDITFIILDNSTTAMTGHQPTPGVSYDIVGNPTASQDMEAVIRGMAGDQELTIVRVNPERRREYGELLEKTFLQDGVKVVIADKECGIMRLRRQRRQERADIRRRGYLSSWVHMNVNQDICRFCLACAEFTGCPGLKHVWTDYGRKMDTDITWCVNDGACHRVGACSAFEHVTIRRKRPPRSRVPELGLDSIPEPQKRPVGDIWRCCLVGVGGMGIGLATSILVRAGHYEKYPVVFLDKKGLAIRNGGVVSQVVYNLSGKPYTAVIPYGKADLLLGMDVLEAARALDPKGRMRVASPERTAAVINTDKVATSTGLLGLQDFDPVELEQRIRANTCGDDFLARDISRICQKYLGSKLYANIMMLGFAFQKGLIPVSMHAMAWAIKDTIRADFRKNLYAFNMGRKLVVLPDLFQGPPRRTDWRDVLEEKCRHTIRRYRLGQKRADGLRALASGAVAQIPELEEALKRDLVVRLYDCMRYDGLAYAARYADAVVKAYAADRADTGFAVTRAVIHNLASGMLIKDAVFVAELATSPEKHARDREKYNVNPANGDRIIYRHLLHPDIRIGSRRFAPDVVAYDWMFNLLKRMRWLRKLLPEAHKEQRQYLRQYEAALTGLDLSTPEKYRQALTALSSARCINCTNPRCRDAGCPLANHISQWVQLAFQGRWQEAAEKLHETNNFPELTARICPAPCQDACKRLLDGYAVGVKGIERQIADRAMHEGWLSPRPPARRTGRRVAVIGSGPAGLAAAQQLARGGHDVTVFEKESRPGGLLRYGIPDFRLDKELVDRRVGQLTAEGVAFKTGVEIGRDLTAAELKKQFDAVLLATGAARPRDLDVPGRQGRGVFFALDFLRQSGGTGFQPVQSGGTDPEGDGSRHSQPVPDKQTEESTGCIPGPPISAKGKTVAVIGGGLTGEDCVESALLQGAKEVHQLEILPEGQSAAGAALAVAANVGPGELAWPHENVHRNYCVSTKAFVANGQDLELRAVKVQWQRAAAGGLAMKELPGTEFSLKVDLALLALGFEPAADSGLAGQLGLATDDHGRLVVSDYKTSVPGVFAAGDVVTGSACVATAIDSGRKAAAKISEFLS